jgi:ABC-2 type transport system ATP-binding protein
VAIIDHGQIIALDTPANLIRQQGLGLIRLSILDGLIDAVEAQVRRLPLVREVNRRDHTLDIQIQESQPALLDVLKITQSLSAQVTALEILEASLETVFLNLTGKSLRE